MKRALAIAVPATLMAACVASLDGFSTGPSPADGGEAGRSATEAGADTSADARAVVDGPTVSADPYGDAVRVDTPSAWYRFEAPLGGTLKDEQGKYPGTGFGDPPTSARGASGAGGLFEGSNGFDLGDHFDFAGQVEFAIELWEQDDQPVNDYETALGKRVDNPDPQDGWVLFLAKSDRTLGFQFWVNGSVTASAQTDNGLHGLHHIVLTQARSSGGGVDVVLYVDAVAQTRSSLDYMGNEADTQQNLGISLGWRGLLDEIALYEHALSPARIAAHFAAATQ